MQETMEIIIPDGEKALAESVGILSDAETFMVETDDNFVDAQLFVKQLKGHEKFVLSVYGDEIKQAHGLHKSLKNKENILMSPIKKARSIMNGKIVAYQQQKLTEARERAAKLEAERVAKAEVAEAKAIYHGSEVVDILEEEDATDIEIVVEKPPMAQGVSLVETWGFEIVDESKLPRDFMVPDLKRIRQVVRAMKDKTNIPGVLAKVETGVRAQA